MPFRTTGGPRTSGHRLYFSAGKRTVVAETSEPEFLVSARRLFPSYEVPQLGDRSPGRVDVTLSRDGRGFVVASLDAPAVPCKSHMDALVAFEFALSRTLATSFLDCTHIHSSGAVVDGRAVLALGESGAGKSSLAVSLISRGHRTLGDDTVFVSPTAMAVPFKRLLKVVPAVLAEMDIDPTSTVHWDPDWPEAWYDPREGAGWAPEAPIAVLALVGYAPKSPIRVTPIPSAEALSVLIGSVLSTGLSAGDSFDTLLKVVEGAQAYRMEFPSAIEGADALVSLIR